MKPLYFILILICFNIITVFSQGIGIGTTTPNASAALDVSSVTQGMLVPRMTTIQRTAISNPANGLLVFDMTTSSFWFRGSAQWIELVDTMNTVIHKSGTDIYMGMNGKVGIGTPTPTSKLEVKTALASPGITHTDGNVTLRTSTSANAGIISTVSNHSLQLNANNGSNHFTISPQGYIGIGIANVATAMLEVNRGNAPDGTLLLKGTSFHSYFNRSTNENTFINGGKAGSQVIINGDPSLGNVGIGTNTPTQKLHVVGNTLLQGNVGISMNTPAVPLHFPETTGNKIALYGNSGPHFGFGIAANLMQIYTPVVGTAIGFGVGNSTSFSENMRLTGDGKLGIGTNAPTEKLSVSGNANISGGLAVGGGVAIGLGLAVGGGVGIGGALGVGISTPSPSAALDVSSTTKGFLMPRMTSAQRDAIPSPEEGLSIYNTETNSPWYRTDNEWEEIKPDTGSSTEQLVFRSGPSSIYMGLDEYVGVGTTEPEHPLQVFATNAQNSSYGLSHTNGEVDIATYISSAGGGIGTISNHPFKLFSNDGGQQFVLTQEGKVGIGTATPHGSLQISNGESNRRLILHEEANDGHHFAGFGINGNSLRYQVPTATASHMFYGGTTDPVDSSKLLMQIKGNGNVGIGVANPANQLDIHDGPHIREQAHPSERPLYVTGNMEPAENGVEFRKYDGTQGIGFGTNTIYAAGNDANHNLGLSAKGATGSLRFLTNGLERLFITGPGNIGIGTITPNAPLQFGNSIANRKIVLWEISNNDHQYYGLGINGSTFRYQVGGPTDNHVFYAGTSASSSRELLRITGEGYVGIGTSAPLASLEVARGTGVLGTAMFKGTTYASHFNYAANEDTYIRGGKAGANVLINDLAGLGNVGIGTTVPLQKLHVAGNAFVSGNHGVGNLTPLNKVDILTSARSGSHPANLPLYVTGDIGAASQGIEFRHTNGTQGIGIGFNTVYAAGSNTDQDLGLAAKGATGNLLFTTNGSEKIRVASGGNVGILNNNPTERLSIGSFNNSANTYLQISTTGANQFKAGIKLRHYSSGYGWTLESDETQTKFNIKRHLADDAGIEALTIDGFNGNVGIGTNNPAQKLAVNGDVKVNGTALIGYEVIESTTNVPPSSNVTTSCACPEGYKVLGGGWIGPNLDVIRSSPNSSGSAWVVSVNNLLPFNSYPVGVYAICARVGN